MKKIVKNIDLKDKVLPTKHAKMIKGGPIVIVDKQMNTVLPAVQAGAFNFGK